MKIGSVNVWHVLTTLFLSVAGSVGFMTLRNQTQPAPIIIQPAPTAAPPAATSTPAPLTIFVNGAVNTPGLYDVPAGARVQDAVEAAGGFASNAFVDGVNLAEPVFDGVQVYVSTVADSAEIQQTLLSNPVQGNPPSNASETTSNDSAITADGLVNINSASRDQLEEISGVGPSTAQSIVSYREDNGPFTDIEEIMNVSGIGEGKFDQMKDSITVWP